MAAELCRPKLDLMSKSLNRRRFLSLAATGAIAQRFAVGPAAAQAPTSWAGLVQSVIAEGQRFDPALVIDPLVCKGFWDGGDCDAVSPITVTTGSAGPDDDPSILALFPNDAPHRTPTVVETDT